ncbi:conserved Plasmodium protein, unknown function [Plasmodium berghei]|uniref:GYF domain-containing protein n=1 Tax=Plasmodium berghei TaxID=5821 RepID=A0A1D3PWC2_PLABE|nr:conserved Plasmodium protein, unknown function [Plasmodium berghei]
MLNEQSVEVDLKKIETELVSCHDNTEKTKKKKKVQFSEKNETLYYEKDENENSYFNFALNNFNYFESFYNRMYNADFNDQEIQKYDTFLNVNDKILEYNEMDEDEEEEDIQNNFLKKNNLVNSAFKGVNKLKIDLHSKINKRDSNSTSDDNEKNNASYSKKDKFAQSFSEDCSFEINDIQSAIINAEEKTTYYNKDYFGYEIEPFNMKNELQEGYIDKDGNYIYHDSKNNKVEEAWLKSIDENESFSNNKLHTQIHKEIISKSNNNINTDIYDNSLSVNIYDGLYSLSCLLADKETPIKAMIRYKNDLKNCKNYLNQCKTNLEEARVQESQKDGTGENLQSSKDRVTPNELQVNIRQSDEYKADVEKEKEDKANAEKEKEDKANVEKEKEDNANVEKEKEDKANVEKEKDKANVEKEKEDKANVEKEKEDKANVEKEKEEASGDTIQNEHKKKMQQLEEVYQKALLDYKTIERQFNNIIDLTQKLTNEYKNVYFLTKNEFEEICKKLEECKESGNILWQLKWQSDVNNNIYGPYNYYDIYNFISLGIVSAANPILLRRVSNENKMLENIWQSYDTVNYLNFVNNDNVKKKRKLNEINIEDSEGEQKEVDSSTDDNEYDIQKKKKKKKGLIQISKKKEKISNEDDTDNEDDFESYGI